MPKAPQHKRTVDKSGNVTVNGKVGNGEGTVYFHERDQAWRASYVVLGKRRWVQAKTRAKAVERRDAAITEGLRVRRGDTRFTATTTVGEFAAWWLADDKRHRVTQSSLDEYRRRIERFGDLRHMAVTAVTLEGLISWQSDLMDTYSPKTVASTRQTVCEVFRRAVALGVIQYSPTAGLLAPHVPESKGVALTIEETGRLLEETKRSRYGTVVHILFTQGPRVSEALGLGWGDIDLDAGTVLVQRAVTYDSIAGQHLSEPKTKGAKGLHHLAPGAVTMLRAWRKRQAADRLRAPSWPTYTYNGAVVDLVFTQADGRLVSRQHVDTLLRNAARRCGIDPSHLGTHVGRRTVVTVLYEAGENVDDIAQHVGHRNAATTKGYVKRLGPRPAATAAAAARLLDRTGD